MRKHIVNMINLNPSVSVDCMCDVLYQRCISDISVITFTVNGLNELKVGLPWWLRW